RPCRRRWYAGWAQVAERHRLLCSDRAVQFRYLRRPRRGCGRTDGLKDSSDRCAVTSGWRLATPTDARPAFPRSPAECSPLRVPEQPDISTTSRSECHQIPHRADTSLKAIAVADSGLVKPEMP